MLDSELVICARRAGKRRQRVPVVGGETAGEEREERERRGRECGGGGAEERCGATASRTAVGVFVVLCKQSCVLYACHLDKAVGSQVVQVVACGTDYALRRFAFTRSLV